MLDKTIEFHSIIMKHPNNIAPILPDIPYMMDCFYRLMPGCPVWLDTQTWSYKAVGIYMDIGFIPMKKATYSNVKNEYDDALRTMKGKMREDKYKQFIELAEE